MRVQAVMTREVIWVGADDTLEEAYEIMKEFEIRHLPVVKGKRLLGMLSQGDILLRASTSAEKISVPRIPVAAAMTSDVVTCFPHSSVANAAATMIECKIDSIPVVDNAGELVGLVTSADLLDILCQQEEANGQRVTPFDYRVRRHGEVEPEGRPSA